MTTTRRLSLVLAVVGFVGVLAFVLFGGGSEDGQVAPPAPSQSASSTEASPPPSAFSERVEASGVAEAAVLVARDRWTRVSTVVLLASDDERAVLASVGVAAALRVPVLVDELGGAEALAEELAGLGVERVVLVGADADRLASTAQGLTAFAVETIGAAGTGVDVEAAAWLDEELGTPVERVVAPDLDVAGEVLGAVARRSSAGPATVLLLAPRAGDDVTDSGGGMVLDEAVTEADLERRWGLAARGVLLQTPVDPVLNAVALAGAARSGERVVAIDGLGDEKGLRRLQRSTVAEGTVRALAAGEPLDELVGTYAEALATAGRGLLPPLVGERLGLHVTDLELAAWRERAASGPFRAPDDVAPGSPGDWERIELRADEVRDDPEDFVWEGPGGDGCVEGRASTRDDPPADAGWVRDLAFRALVLDDAEDRALAAELLVEQARLPNLDFLDRSRWCLGEINDLNPGFEIANWLTSLLYALEYVEIGDRLGGTSSLATDEVHEVVDWLASAATWMMHDTNRSLRRNFDARTSLPGPPYPLTADRRDEEGGEAVLAEVEAEVGSIAFYYNNRRAQLARYVGLVALHVQQRPDGHRPAGLPEDEQADDLLDDAVRYVQDWLVYSVYPEGFTGDFERWKESLPDLGWFYGTATAAPAVTLADALARAGDRRLLDYVTTDGAQGSAGRPEGESGKSLPWIVRTLFGYVDGTVVRHVPGHEGSDEGRVDGRDDDWHGIHHLALLPLNRHVHAPGLELTALWPPGGPALDPAGFGQYDVHTGDWGTLPGVLFMFALEGGPAEGLG